MIFLGWGKGTSAPERNGLMCGECGEAGGHVMFYCKRLGTDRGGLVQEVRNLDLLAARRSRIAPNACEFTNKSRLL